MTAVEDFFQQFVEQFHFAGDGRRSAGLEQAQIAANLPQAQERREHDHAAAGQTARIDRVHDCAAAGIQHLLIDGALFRV